MARALSILSTAADAPVTPSVRAQLAEAGADLESLGEYARAAEAYAAAEDIESQGRALARAGDVDRLDTLLAADQTRTREARSRRYAHAQFDLRVASGQRRDAAELSRTSDDAALRARGRALEATRLTGPTVPTKIRGRDKTIIVLGDRVLVGRRPTLDDGELGTGFAIGEIVVASVAVSRRHLMIARRGGEFVLRDLGSHNGTRIDGVPVVDEVTVGDGLELRLGFEVSVVVRPAVDWPGAAAIEVTGVRYIAPLGRASLGIGRWRLECNAIAGIGNWVDLVTEDDPPAFAGGLRLAARIGLLAGDAISTDRDGDVAVAFGE